MWRYTAEHQGSGVLYLDAEPSAMNSIPSVVSVRWLEMNVLGLAKTTKAPVLVG
jgi:hypothetical protein